MYLIYTCISSCHVDEATLLFFKYVVKYWGLSKDSISYRDTQSRRRSCTTYFDLLDSDLKFSTVDHPRIN